MAKKSSTVHLEEKVWKEIEEYKTENGLSSRNDAIEQMFVERRLLLKLTQNTTKNEISATLEVSKEEIRDEDINLDKAIYFADADMPD
ncbi:MAG: hypothetical protein RSA57_03980 [Cetobacterium sp.]|uniref:hypothetical protein n=1 Tax=Bacteria TaxID=2 RepID=UPI002FC7CC70